MSSPDNMLGLVELSDQGLDGTTVGLSEDVLKSAFCERLKHWVRPKDEWQLLDNNRMCVVLTGVSSTGELELAAAKLQRVFNEPHYHQGRIVPMEVKVGFAQYDGDEAQWPKAVQRASLALNQAKNSSRLFEIYSPVQVKDRQAERQLLQRLKRALDVGEFQLYYQPKVHARLHNLIGAEALIRWHTSDGKVVMPDEFIDLAERHDIIKPITWWGIKSAVGRLARWPEDTSIAVNISPRLLLDDNIIAVVQDALDIYGVSPARLTLEVTEKIMVDRHDIMVAQLARLRELGLKIALDDFGTGFSSLAYFRELPVDEIKIDQSFVRNMLTSKKDLAIVRAVIDLAHNFSLQVVAEGVESMDIAERLDQMRCDALQGFVYDQPLPVEDFERAYRIR